MDLSEFFNDISADAPCGVDLEYDNERVALDTSIQGTPEDQFSGQKSEPPNWRDVQKQSLSLLKKSKDLQVIIYLIRSLIQLEGIKGFRDGLQLLEKSISDYWETVFPLLDPDDGDPTQRLNIVEGLCSRESVLNPLSLCVFAENKAVGRFCLRDIYYATEKLPLPEGVSKPDIALIKAVFNDTELEVLQSNYQSILESAQLLQQIESEIAGKVAGLGNGVNLEAIKALLKDMRFNFEQFVGDKLNGGDQQDLVDDETAGAENADTAGISRKPAAKGVGEITSRHDVVKTLDLLCKYYAEYEPSSPVPIFLQRAKILANSNFMEIVKNLIPDAIGQVEHIKGPDSN